MPLAGLILLIALTAAGVATLALGLRGRRINDHPHCRRCRFDLSGLNIGAESARCPECGGELSKQRAIRIGSRRRRTWLAAAGVCLFLIGAGGLAVTVVVIVRGVNIDHYTPVRILLLQADRGDQARQATIIAELIRRKDDGALRPSDHRRAALSGIGHLERDGAAWTPEWFDIIEPARRMGVLEEDEALRYLRALAQPRLITRSRVRSADTMPLSIVWTMAPTPLQSPYLLRLRAEFDEVLIDGVSIRPGPRGVVRSTTEISGLMGSRGRNSETVRLSTPASAGPFEITATLKVTAIAWDPANRRRSLDYFSEDDIRYSWEIESTAAAEALPHGEDSVRLITDDETRAALRESITVDKVLIRTDRLHSASVTIPVQFSRPPCDIVFIAALIRGDGESKRFDALTLRPSMIGRSSTATFLLSESYRAAGEPEAKSFLAQSEYVDVVFRPNLDRARQVIELEEIWGEEIIFRDVPVIREDADGVRTHPPPTPPSQDAEPVSSLRRRQTPEVTAPC